jgi:plastocyanin
VASRSASSRSAPGPSTLPSSSVPQSRRAIRSRPRLRFTLAIWSKRILTGAAPPPDSSADEAPTSNRPAQRDPLLSSQNTAYVGELIRAIVLRPGARRIRTPAHETCGKPRTAISACADGGRGGVIDTAKHPHRRRSVMNRKIHIRAAGLAVAALSAVLVSSALAAPTNSATLTIRHQMRGCHTWSFDSGASKASLAITLKRGTVMKVVNNDVMPHKLLVIAGPKAKLTTPAMNRMSAVAHVTFTKAGVYKLTTRPGEDYPGMKGMKTIGKDNVLRLTVRVS